MSPLEQAKKEAAEAKARNATPTPTPALSPLEQAKKEAAEAKARKAAPTPEPTPEPVATPPKAEAPKAPPKAKAPPVSVPVASVPTPPKAKAPAAPPKEYGPTDPEYYLEQSRKLNEQLAQAQKAKPVAPPMPTPAQAIEQLKGMGYEDVAKAAQEAPALSMPAAPTVKVSPDTTAPLEKRISDVAVAAAANDPALRAKAEALLATGEFRDALRQPMPDSAITNRTLYMMQRDGIVNPGVNASAEDREAYKKKYDSYKSKATEEIATLRTVGYWPGVPISDPSPTSELEAMGRRRWIAGIDSKGQYIYETQSPGSYALDAISMPATYLATKLEQEVLGPEHALGGEYVPASAAESIQKRRSFSDVAQAHKYDTEAGRLFGAMAGAAADVLTPDPISMATFGLGKVAGGAAKAAKYAPEAVRAVEGLWRGSAVADKALEGMIAALRADDIGKARALYEAMPTNIKGEVDALFLSQLDKMPVDFENPASMGDVLKQMDESLSTASDAEKANYKSRLAGSLVDSEVMADELALMRSKIGYSPAISAVKTSKAVDEMELIQKVKKLQAEEVVARKAGDIKKADAIAAEIDKLETPLGLGGRTVAIEGEVLRKSISGDAILSRFGNDVVKYVHPTIRGFASKAISTPRSLVMGTDMVADWAAKGIGPELIEPTKRVLRKIAKLGEDIEKAGIKSEKQLIAFLEKNHARSAYETFIRSLDGKEKVIATVVDSYPMAMQDRLRDILKQYYGMGAVDPKLIEGMNGIEDLWKKIAKASMATLEEKAFVGRLLSLEEAPFDTLIMHGNLSGRDPKALLNEVWLDPRMRALRGNFGERISKFRDFERVGNGRIPKYVPGGTLEQIREATRKIVNVHPNNATEVTAATLLSNWSTAVTRGNVYLKPGYFVNNMFGNIEQVFITSGNVTTALRYAVRSEFLNLIPVGVGILQEVGSVVGRAAFGGVGGMAGFAAPTALLGVGERGKAIIGTLAKILQDTPDRLLTGLLTKGSFQAHVSGILGNTNKLIKIGGREYTYASLYEEAVRGGVLDGFDISALREDLQSAMKLPMQEAIQEIAEVIGTRQRLGLYVTFLEEGFSKEQAAELVVKSLYDYTYTISNAEKNVLVKAVAPFWRWQKNANAQMLGAMTNTGSAYRLGAYLKGRATVQDWIDYSYTSSYDAYGVGVDRMTDEQRQKYESNVYPLLRALQVRNNWTNEQVNEYLLNFDPVSGSDRASLFQGVPESERTADMKKAAEVALLVRDAQEYARNIKRDTLYHEAMKARLGSVASYADGKKATIEDVWSITLPPSGMEGAMKWSLGIAATGASLAASLVGPSLGHSEMKVSPIEVMYDQWIDLEKLPAASILSDRPVEISQPMASMLESTLSGYSIVEKNGRYYLNNPAQKAVYQLSGMESLDQRLRMAMKNEGAVLEIGGGQTINAPLILRGMGIGVRAESEGSLDYFKQKQIEDELARVRELKWREAAGDTTKPVPK